MGNIAIELDLKRTALLIIDPQNDFLSEGGVVWDLVGEGVKENHVVEHLVQLKQTAKEIGIPVVYSPQLFGRGVQFLVAPEPDRPAYV